MGRDAGRHTGRDVHKACSPELVAAGDKSNASNPCEGQRQAGARRGPALEQLPRTQPGSVPQAGTGTPGAAGARVGPPVAGKATEP